MAVTRYIGFVIMLSVAVFSAAAFDARMRGDAPPALQLAYPAFDSLDIRGFMQRIEGYLEQVRLDEFLRTVKEKTGSLGPAGKEAQ